MQGPPGNWNFRRPGATCTENMQWNQNFRPRGPHGGNIQNCDYQHWCETCDKGFATATFLENHKLQHQKCNIDGCQFVAHPKIITKHIQMQHSTGIFKRIAKLNNPEDIEKWREERKSKYPTIENIKKKEAAIKEKINRGEKMGMKNNRNRNDKTEFHHKTNQRLSQTGRANFPEGKHNRNIANNRKRDAIDVTKKSNMSKKICKASPLVEENRTLKPFAGIESLQIDDDLDEEIEPETHCSVPIEDDEDIHNASDRVQNETSVSEPTVCSALTSLMCCYESSDEEDVKTNTQKELKELLNGKAEYKDEMKCFKNSDKISTPVNETKSREKTNEKVPVNNNVELKDSESKVTNCQGASDDESGPEEVKINKEGTNLPVDDTKILKTRPIKELSAKKINRPAVKKHEYRKRNKLPSTLLEKLLHKEIQHERNVILQCVRYVVKNKYFD
ncbi:nuclear fragile X mental retardation-interacting protein 1 [Maniola jurtina]|uniref:nuclear fragile X mental retardation-interacting protein 1 n=1 Tax=Maniola jurtina TaxID=191418 RepID=UPI001E68EB90|nr:nuclear fragile X mental retardation-interacting protein 1 [Maniola jurtina]XP_045766765.1 nuclear fragile X mental retardation-interacting protein 1 [Maniola jurtina]